MFFMVGPHHPHAHVASLEDAKKRFHVLATSLEGEDDNGTPLVRGPASRREGALRDGTLRTTPRVDQTFLKGKHPCGSSQSEFIVTSHFSFAKTQPPVRVKLVRKESAKLMLVGRETRREKHIPRGIQRRETHMLVGRNSFLL